jgi:DNA invertase Pin-like site-specific DNA recombinase
MLNGSGQQAVIYARVSSIKQTVEGAGLASQETRCREFAKLKGYAVTEVFTDDVSESLIDRPGMKAMLAYLRRHRAKGVVVIIDDLTRLARNLKAHLELRAAIGAAGGVLASPSIEFGDSSDSLLVENLLASVSQHQRQKNGEQTKNRMRARVLDGFAVTRAPVGFKYRREPGRGRVLVRDEPLASVIVEALEGYAAGRFETQADVARFFEAHPLFPKERSGIVRRNRAADILRCPLYAGYIEAPGWGVSLRPARHEGLISFQTFQRIQERLNGINRQPQRRNLKEDFPLRGFVACASCNRPLTACWSTGSHGRYAYYLCHGPKCPEKGKSIRRDVIEGEVEALLKSARPGASLFQVASRIFRDLWDQRLVQAKSGIAALEAQRLKIEKQVAQLLDRIVEATVPSVVKAYEQKIEKLKADRLTIQERLNAATPTREHFGKTLRTALAFLATLGNSGKPDGLKTGKQSYVWSSRADLPMTGSKDFERRSYLCPSNF